VPPTIVRGIVPGRPIPSPAYPDANVLISYFVARTNSPAAIQAVAEMLAQGTETVFSALTLAEFWWGIFDALYNRDRAAGGDAPQRITPGEYRRQHRHVFDRHGREIAVIRDQLRSWPNLRGTALQARGVPQWLGRLDQCLGASGLLPSDAVHVSLAERHARCLITNDRAFADPSLPVSGLAIVVV
jgi:predicted nucleic acid-binding protein